MIHVTVYHIEFGATIAGPVNRSSPLFIGKGIDGYLVRYHKCGVEAQSEVSDDLIVIGLVLVLLNEVRCTGKGDPVDVFLHFIGRHTETVIDEL